MQVSRDTSEEYNESYLEALNFAKTLPPMFEGVQPPTQQLQLQLQQPSFTRLDLQAQPLPAIIEKKASQETDSFSRILHKRGQSDSQSPLSD